MADPRARQLRTNTTNAERRLWRELRVLKVKGLHFRRQAPMGRYYVDFMCHSARLVVELDGRQHSGAAAAYDEKRTEFLRSRGYTVLRFWNFEVIRDRQSVVNAIFTVATLPRPEIAGAISTSPQGGG